MRGSADDLDLDPDEAFVGGGNGQLGRFGDDRRVRADAAQDLLDADAGVLLVGDRRDDDP